MLLESPNSDCIPQNSSDVYGNAEHLILHGEETHLRTLIIINYLKISRDKKIKNYQRINFGSLSKFRID